MKYSDNPVIYSGEFYEVHYSPKYSVNYAIFNKITEVYEEESNILSEAIRLMFQLDSALMDVITEDELVNVEVNVAKAKTLLDEGEPF